MERTDGNAFVVDDAVAVFELHSASESSVVATEGDVGFRKAESPILIRLISRTLHTDLTFRPAISGNAEEILYFVRPDCPGIADLVICVRNHVLVEEEIGLAEYLPFGVGNPASIDIAVGDIDRFSAGFLVVGDDETLAFDGVDLGVNPIELAFEYGLNAFCDKDINGGRNLDAEDAENAAPIRVPGRPEACRAQEPRRYRKATAWDGIRGMFGFLRHESRLSFRR